MLDERKLRVLYAVINSHLISAEPIGSRTISKDYDLGVSAATIRNEMSDLEEKGFLTKPHSSAGRIPSDKAYRLYVNEILKLKRPEFIDESERFKEFLYEESSEVEDIIRNSARILSSLTSYTALAVSPQAYRSKLKHIQLMSISEDKVLMVIVNSSGIIKNSILRTSREMEDDELLIISNVLNEKFTGLTIDEIIRKIEVEKIDEDYKLAPILENLMPIVRKSLKDINNIELYSDGVTKILNFPEYNDLEKAKNFISFIEDKELVIDLLMNMDKSDNSVDITIGTENDYEAIKDCSIITANYSIGNRSLGKIGIIGPTRMDYLHLINVLNSFSRDISDVLSRFLK